MNSRSALRLCLVLFWLLALLAPLPARFSSHWPPPSLQAWAAEAKDAVLHPAHIAVLVTLAVTTIVSSFGLFFFRRWAAPVFLASTVISYGAVGLLGPHVIHGAGYALEGVSALSAGAVIALCFWSDALKVPGR